MKKFMAIALSAAILTTMSAGLSGCGSNSAKGGTLKWIQVGKEQSGTAAVLDKVNKIIEPELGMKVEMEFFDTASYKEKSKLKMASGENFDLIWTGYLNDYQTAVSLEGLKDITDDIKNIKMANGSTVKMSDVVEDFFMKAANVDGKIYGIPNMQVVSNPLAFKMRKSVADECGVDLKGLQEKATSMKSMADATSYMNMLTDELAKVKAKRPDLYTINPGTNAASTEFYEEIVGSVGIKKDGSSKEIVNIRDTDEFKLGVDKAREWQEKGYIRQDIASKGNAITSTDEEKQYGVTQTTWKPGQDTTDKLEMGEDVVFSYFENPYVPRTNPLATMLAVGKNSKHSQEAVKLIYLLNSNKELYNTFCWGIEGTNYKKNADGTATEIKNSGYNDISSSAWEYGNQFNSFVTEGQTADVWDQTKKMNDDAKKSPAMGFVPNTENITTEIANITNVNSEYKAKVEFGTSPRTEYWDEYMAKLKAAGIDKVREEIQKQYDKFLAK